MTNRTTKLNRYLFMIGLSIVLGLARYYVYDDADFGLFDIVDKNSKEVEVDLSHFEKVKKISYYFKKRSFF